MKPLFALTSIVRQSRRLRWSETVKATIVLLSVAFASAPLLSGQVNCPTSASTTSTAEAPMVCQYPFNGTVLANILFAQGQSGSANPALTSAVVTAASLESQPLNASIATQLSQLPMPSAAVGTVSLRLPGSDTPKPFSNLGPILTDRPDPVQRGKFFLSFAYQHFNFTDIDAQPLSSLSLGVSTPSVTVTNPSNGSTSLETFYASMVSKVNFTMNQYIGLLTFGLTKTTDVSVVVPINSVSMNVTSSNYQGYLYVQPTQPAGSPYFATLTSASGQVPTITTGSATGIGDVTVNVKQQLLGQEGRYAVALGGQVRFPTGNSSNYLGSGAYGVNIYGLVEYRGSWRGHGIAPHVKFGYQWNGQSQIMDISKSPYKDLPGGLDYAFGMDIGLHKSKLTVALDGVGHQYVNAPTLTTGTISLPIVPTSQQLTIPSMLPTLNTGVNTYTTLNFSGGVKYLPWKHMLLYANLMVPINNVGLHSDPVPLVGIGFK
jgi:hypothetical protein